MSTIYGPPVSGVIGTVPERAPIRADFTPGSHENQIETKGARFIWSRGALCPCASKNKQADQTDPLCTLCNGYGWLFFGPKDYAAPSVAGELDTLQKTLVVKEGGAVIRGLMSGVSRQDDPLTQYGNWVFGTAMVTVRPENRLGYYDRLIHLDSVLPHTELLEVPEDGLRQRTRFLVRAVNLLRDLERQYEEGADFTIETGEVRWVDGQKPPADTRLTIHYLCHPHWIVIEQPKAIREETTLLRGRRIAPVGASVPLPIQAMVKLEFLVR